MWTDPADETGAQDLGEGELGSYFSHTFEVLRRPLLCVCRMLWRKWRGGWRMGLCSALSEETLPFPGLRIDLI